MAQFNSKNENELPSEKGKLSPKVSQKNSLIVNPNHHKINNHYSNDNIISTNPKTANHVKFSANTKDNHHLRQKEPDPGSQSSSDLERRHTTNQSKKKTKKRKLEKERKKWKKKMKEIGRSHPEFELSYDLLLGIRTSTSTVNSSVIRSSAFPEDDDSSEDDDELLDKEFGDSKRYSFPSSGSSQTPPHHMNDFEFKDYCRPIFAQLREWFGIKPQTYLVKLCGGFNLLEFISNSKSGQFFFYSHDGQFLIKSMTRSECKLMRQILPQYYHHVKNQPNTLLTKFYGMYRVKTHNRQAIYFIVMGSVFYTDLEIHKIYDLKGSTHGRRATTAEKSAETPVLKDLDWLENEEFLKIGKLKCKLYKEQLRRDTELLKKLKIMDYSLLVGFHYTNRPATYFNLKKQSSIGSEPNTPMSKESLNGHNYNDKNDKNNNNNVIDAIPEVLEFDMNATSTHSDPGSHAYETPKKNNTTSSNPHMKISNKLQMGDITPLPDEDGEVAGSGSEDGDVGDEPKNEEKYSVKVNKISVMNKSEVAPKPSTTMLSETPDMSLTNSNKTPSNVQSSNAEIDEKIAIPIEKGSLNNKVNTTQHRSVLSVPMLKKVNSRRLSQIGMKQTFTVKTPIGKNFDMPELIDVVAMKRNLEMKSNDLYSVDEYDETTNIFCRDNGGMKFEDEEGNKGDVIYFTGIIDILQKYNKRKKVEHFFRGINTDTDTISSVPPDRYARRMYDFLKEKIV